MPLIGRENLNIAIDNLKVSMNDDVRGAYLAGLKNVIEPTPADTGVHRNNWFLTVGSPSNSFGRVGDKTGGGSIASALKMPMYVLDKDIYFTNNAPGIIPLEYGGYPKSPKKGSYIKKSNSYEKLSTNGWSNQVGPGGWVRKAVILMRNKIRSL